MLLKRRSNTLSDRVDDKTGILSVSGETIERIRILRQTGTRCLEERNPEVQVSFPVKQTRTANVGGSKLFIFNLSSGEEIFATPNRTEEELVANPTMRENERMLCRMIKR